MKICDVCGLPEELCVCEEIAREVQTVKVFTVRRRFGKLMTIVEGIDEHDIDIKELTKELKAKCADFHLKIFQKDVRRIYENFHDKFSLILT